VPKSPVSSQTPLPKGAKAQVHLSFLSKQLTKPVNERFLRQILQFFVPAEGLLQVTLKRCRIEPEISVQSGYGFVYFPSTPQGHSYAHRIVQSFQKTSVYDVTLDCKFCDAQVEAMVMKDLHLLEQQGQQLQQQNLPQHFEPNAADAFDQSNQQMGRMPPSCSTLPQVALSQPSGMYASLSAPLSQAHVPPPPSIALAQFQTEDRFGKSVVVPNPSTSSSASTSATTSARSDPSNNPSFSFSAQSKQNQCDANDLISLDFSNIDALIN
jgi:hypothetical protein